MTGRLRFLDYVNTDLHPPFLLISCGLPCTLKSTVVNRVAQLKNCAILRTDAIRRELLKGEDIFDTRVGGDMSQRSRVYDELFSRAEGMLPEVECLILDATFITGGLREKAAAVAAHHGVPFIIVETVSPREVALARLRDRRRETSESNAVTEEAYFDNERRFEPVDIDTLAGTFPGLVVTHIVVDTSEFAPPSWTLIRREERP